MQTGAEISACGNYRYFLFRTWEMSLRKALFIMLNPSTADGREDDPTIRRCIDFAKRLGCGGLHVVNLFAYRATSPADMMNFEGDVVGKDNDYWIGRALHAGGPVILAYGANGSHLGRDREVLKIIRKYNEPWRVFTLGTTTKGLPRHPLYLPKDAPLELFREAA